MPAPTNTSFATATDLGTTLPQSVSQNAHDGGVTYTLWFKITPPTGINALGAWGYGDQSVYLPTTTFWTDASTQVFGAATNVPAQVPVTAGTPIYLKVTPNGGNPTPAVLELELEPGPTQTLAAGMIAINDSTPGYPAVIMNGATAEPVAFRHPFSAGEGTAVLRDSGIVAALDTDINAVKIYNADFSVRAVPTMPASGYDDAMGTNQIETFWVGKSGGGATHAFMVSMDKDGTFGTPIDLGSAGLNSLSPNASNTLVYFIKTQSTENQPVRVVDTSTSVITTFLAGVANYSHGANLMMLTDDTLLVPYARSGFATLIRRYNEAGSLLNTYTLAVDLNIEHIFADPDDPDYFWIWTQTSTHNTFSKIRVSDGTEVVTAGPWIKFIEGVYEGAWTATPEARFGADFSCKPWILRAAGGGVGEVSRTSRRGIYVPTRGVGGAEGGGEGISFDFLDSRRIPVPVQKRKLYVSTGAEGGGFGTGSQSILGAGRTIYLAAGRKRAIYVPPDAEGDIANGARTIVVPKGAEGYTHR